MAAHDLLAGVADELLGEAASYDLRAPLPSAPPLLSRDTHGGCDWFTGICSVADRVTWLATGTDRTASCGQSRRTKHSRAPVGKVAPAPREKMSAPGGPAHRGGSGATGLW